MQKEKRDMRAYIAELFGTFWRVLGGCGSAVLAAAFPGVGIVYSEYPWLLV
jgi:aquaporin Z